jgi:hypothetical protein
MRRILVQRPTLSNDAELGPLFGISAHYTFVDPLAAGIYVSHDVSPEGGVPTRQATSAGLRLRLSPRWPTERLRIAVFAGFGFVFATQAGYETTMALSPLTPAQRVEIADASGRFLEIPFGMGFSYAVAPHLLIRSEIAARYGFLFGGSLYDGTRDASATSFPDLQIDPAGLDVLALSLTLGIAYAR